jgi:hypothetical protein
MFICNVMTNIYVRIMQVPFLLKVCHMTDSLTPPPIFSIKIKILVSAESFFFS